MAWHFLRDTFADFLLVGLAVWIAARICPICQVVDWILLQLPIVREGQIVTGALSATLDRAMEKVVELSTQHLQTTLDLFNRIFLRLVAFGVGMSIVGTLLLCLSYAARK